MESGELSHWLSHLIVLGHPVLASHNTQSLPLGPETSPVHPWVRAQNSTGLYEKDTMPSSPGLMTDSETRMPLVFPFYKNLDLKMSQARVGLGLMVKAQLTCLHPITQCLGSRLSCGY